MEEVRELRVRGPPRARTAVCGTSYTTSPPLVRADAPGALSAQRRECVCWHAVGNAWRGGNVKGRGQGARKKLKLKEEAVGPKFRNERASCVRGHLGRVRAFAPLRMLCHQVLRAFCVLWVHVASSRGGAAELGDMLFSRLTVTPYLIKEHTSTKNPKKAQRHPRRRHRPPRATHRAQAS